MASAKTTTDHNTIKKWVEKRGGKPARVKGTGSGDGDPGILRIDYPGYSGEDTLEEIEWDEFFEAFEDNHLAFLYQDEGKSRFSKFVARNGAADEEEEDEEEEEEEEEDQDAEMDAVDLLESQHRDVEALFGQLREAESAEERGELFAELADQLAAHSKIEETIFYPKVCDEDTSEILHHSVEEHLSVKRVIAELLEMEPDDAKFMSKIDELEELVSDHVEDEETELFPQVRESDVDLQALARRMEKKFADLIAAEPRSKVPNEIDKAASLPC